MDFHSVFIENFLTIGQGKEIFLRDRGINLLQGENLDDSSAESNGSGKSSIPDAICWALYGITARGESGDAIVNRTVGANTRVILKLIDDDVLYVVTRTRKYAGSNDLSLRKVKGSATAILAAPHSTHPIEDLTLGTTAQTQERITALMGCSADVFTAAVYAGQEQMPDLPGMTDKQLKKLIEEAAGIDRLSEAHMRAASVALAASRAHVELKNMVDDLAATIAKTKNSFSDAGRNKSEWLVKNDAHIAKLEKDVESRRAEHAEKTKELSRFIGIEPEVVKRQADLKSQIDGYSLQKSRVSEYRSKVVDPADVELLREEAKINSLTKELHELCKKRDEWLESKSPDCSQCGQAIVTEEHRAKALKTMSDAIDAKSSALDAQQRAHTARADRVAALHDTYNTMLSELVDPSDLLKKLSAINSKMLTLQDMKAKVTQAALNLESASEALAVAKGTVNPHQELFDQLFREIAVIGASLSSATAKCEEAHDYSEVCKSVVEVFGPAGVRAHILDTVTPYLNAKTAEYLTALSDGHITARWTTLTRTKAGELREKFGIEVSNDMGADSFKGLSGGEKRKVRLACMLALQDLVASRATKPINLLLCDEIDDALDAPGLERLLGILEKKGRERGTVIVISHRQLSDWIDNVTVVTKKGGVSTIEGALTAL